MNNLKQKPKPQLQPLTDQKRRETLSKSIWTKKCDSEWGTWFMENQLTGEIKMLAGYLSGTPIAQKTNKNTDNFTSSGNNHFDMHKLTPAKTQLTFDCCTTINTTKEDTAITNTDEEAKDNDNDNKSTNHPNDITINERPGPATMTTNPKEWIEYWNDEHLCVYFFNPVTKESTWTEPAEAIIHRMDSPSKLLSSQEPKQNQHTQRQRQRRGARVRYARRYDQHVVSKIQSTSSSKSKISNTPNYVNTSHTTNNGGFRRLRFGGLTMMGSSARNKAASAGESLDTKQNVQSIKNETGVWKKLKRTFGTSIGLNATKVTSSSISRGQRQVLGGHRDFL